MPKKKWFTEEEKIIGRREYHRKWRSNPINCAREREQGRKRCKENPEKVKKAYTEFRVRGREKLCALKKEKECSRCGLKDFRVLDFHHRDPKEKSFDVARHSSRSKKAVENEIAKCDLLCANCHRIVEYEKRQDGFIPKQ